MILDANLEFAKGSDAAMSKTKAIKLGGTAYKSLILHVSAAEDIAAVKVALETCDIENGTFTTVHEWPEKTGVIAGAVIVNDPLPWNVKEWVRVKLSAPCKVNAHLVMDTKLEYPTI